MDNKELTVSDIRELLRGLPGNAPIRISVDGNSQPWEVSLFKAADSENGLTDVELVITTPIKSDMVYIY